MTKTLKAKHTPGPWRLLKFSDSVAVHAGDRGFGDMFRLTIWNAEHVYNIVDRGNEPKETYKPEMEANARLIAAAPALLEALKTICKIPNKYDVAPKIAMEMYEAARDAIAKAEGQ